jgi:mannose/fructose/N-acetylgalactosamine-specific phosphotransferase system component IIC
MVFIFIQLTTLMLLAGYAIKNAESTRWKSVNIGIVIGSMLGGMVLAFAIAYIGHNQEFGMVEALPLSLITGFIAAGGAIAGNTWRAGGIRKGHKVRHTPNDKTVI